MTVDSKEPTLEREELLALRLRLRNANFRRLGGVDSVDITTDDWRTFALLVDAALGECAVNQTPSVAPPLSSL